MFDLTDYAASELHRAVRDGDLNDRQADAVANLVDATFTNSGHSGGSAPPTIGYIAWVVQRVMSCEPLSPLNGTDDEWRDVTDSMPKDEHGYRRLTQQNRRCSRVFRELCPNRTGLGMRWIAYDVERVVWTDRPHGEHCFIAWDSARRIEFPYDPPSRADRHWKLFRWPIRWIARLRDELKP